MRGPFALRAVQARQGWLVGRLLVHAAASLPALWLAQGWMLGGLGLNPQSRLLHVSGLSAVVLLLATLAVTPLRRASVWVARMAAVRFGRRLADWNGLVRLRRALGLWAFFYASLHMGLYAVLDVGLQWAELCEDLLQRPFIAAGLLAWLLLVPLAATSTQAAMRRLGRRWALLHRGVYVAAVLALLHFWGQAKRGDTSPWPFVVLLALLLAARAWGRWRGDDGLPAPERVSAAAAHPPATAHPGGRGLPPPSP